MVTIVILAGGASRRMGRAKALLPFAGETLIERAVARLAALGSETLVVSAPHVDLPRLPRRVRVIEDEIPGLGPVGGIVSALRAARSPLCFVCSCDQPFASAALARHMIGASRGVDLVVPRWRRQLQPLFAVYRRRTLTRFEHAVERGQLRLQSVLRGAPRREVGALEIRRFDPEGRSFFDLDTPQDYRRALRMEKSDA